MQPLENVRQEHHNGFFHSASCMTIKVISGAFFRSDIGEGDKDAIFSFSTNNPQ